MPRHSRSRFANRNPRKPVQDAVVAVDVSVSEPDKDSSTGPKRKATSPAPRDSEEGSNSPKRPRRSEDTERDVPAGSPPAAPAPRESPTDRRASTSQEEKKRGKRLFGGLLNTLSQTTSNSQQKKRQEIERRQQARVHQQRAEDDKYREAKLAKVQAVRKVEQVKFDEQVVRSPAVLQILTRKIYGADSD
jgi:hypothetical protein